MSGGRWRDPDDATMGLLRTNFDAEKLLGVVALIPSPWQEQLLDLRRRHGDPVGAKSIPAHVTLLPPIARMASQMDDIYAHLTEAAAGVEPFQMSLIGPGTFRPVSPVVFAHVAEGISSCEELERRVRSGPLERDLEFSYHPHATVAHGVDEVNLDAAFAALTGFEASFMVNDIVLFEFHDDKVWRPMRQFPLGKRDR